MEGHSESPVTPRSAEEGTGPRQGAHPRPSPGSAGRLWARASRAETGDPRTRRSGSLTSLPCSGGLEAASATVRFGAASAIPLQTARRRHPGNHSPASGPAPTRLRRLLATVNSCSPIRFRAFGLPPAIGSFGWFQKQALAAEGPAPGLGSFCVVAWRRDHVVCRGGTPV